MTGLIITIMVTSFLIICMLANISTKLDKIIDNQDILKCIKKNNK